ncbi:MAG: hypothetical protein LBJ88_04340 [Campylobacteraceae bacterium]|nr:hypothetical protein [Campylobacteraceae bacterium]
MHFELEQLSKFGTIETVKNRIILNNELLPEFKLHNGKYYSYLAIFTSKAGLKYQVVQHSRAKYPTIKFIGLYQYTKTSDFLRDDLKLFMKLFKDKITLYRIDIAFDQANRFNIKQIAKNTKRHIYKKKHYRTSYLKTPKEKKTNQYLDIKHYKKTQDIHRLEFAFKGKRYLVNTDIIHKQIEKAIDVGFEVEELLDALFKEPITVKQSTKQMFRSAFAYFILFLRKCCKRIFEKMVVCLLI